MSKNVLANRDSIWIVTEVYYPEVISTGYYLTSIAEGLAGTETQVQVLCGQPNYAARGTKAPSQETRNGVDIFRSFTTTLDKNVIPYRLINMAVLGLSFFISSLRRFKRGEKVLVVTAPPSLPLTTAVAALIKGSSYTLLLHDCYPDILVAVGKVSSGSISVRLMHRINRWLFKHASRIIVVGRDMQERMLEKTAGLDIPISVIPNWADLENIAPAPRNENKYLNELGLTEKFVITYAGNIGHPTDIETIIDGAEVFAHSNPEVHFIFIGSGVKKAWLEKAVKEKQLSNVSILGQLPRSEQHEFLNACDVGVVSLIPGMWGTAMPSRTYNIMAAGKPILALIDDGSELDKVVREDQIGWSIRPRDRDSFIETVKSILESREDLRAMGERARAAAERKYSLAAAVASYREVLVSE